MPKQVLSGVAYRTFTQLFYSLKPVLFGRAPRAPAGFPQTIGPRRDVFVTEPGNAVPCRRTFLISASAGGMVDGPPGLFRNRQMLVFSALLLRHEMGVLGSIAEFRRSMIVFVV